MKSSRRSPCFSYASFKIGIAAFIVPFMFFYNGAILMEGTYFEIIRAGITSIIGVFLLSSGVQGWFMGGMASWVTRILLIAAAFCLIEGGILTDLAGAGLVAAAYLARKTIGGSSSGGNTVSTA